MEPAISPATSPPSSTVQGGQEALQKTQTESREHLTPSHQYAFTTQQLRKPLRR
ncbi:MAG: hypothetical protein WCY33_06605 [Clostridia bacterium]